MNGKIYYGRLQVYTPLESTNIMLNGWVTYQTLVSRLFGRSGYYQSGGAYGFRDQLQDTLGLKYLEPALMKNQIIKHSKKQEEEFAQDFQMIYCGLYMLQLNILNSQVIKAF